MLVINIALTQKKYAIKLHKYIIEAWVVILWMNFNKREVWIPRSSKCLNDWENDIMEFSLQKL